VIEASGEENPAALEASTNTVYVVYVSRPVIAAENCATPKNEYALRLPTLGRYLYLYPRISLPPLESGTLNDKSIRALPPAAERFFGMLGTVSGMDDADTGGKGEYPAAFDASNNTVYVVPLVRPLIRNVFGGVVGTIE